MTHEAHETRVSQVEATVQMLISDLQQLDTMTQAQILGLSSQVHGLETRSSFTRPTPKETCLRISDRICGTRAAMSECRTSRRAARFPHPISNPTPEIET